MIVTRSPLRITLGGGGTDLRSYYKEYEGFVISAAIDKYVYVAVMQSLIPGILLRYNQLEHVQEANEIRHPIIREAIRILGLESRDLEITTFADIPAGTGLGSSGSFTTTLLKALYLYQRKFIFTNELAQLASEIEIDQLEKPVGKQDQYIAAYGGITCFQFHSDDTVEAFPLKISADTLIDLQDNLLLFFTGLTRNAAIILDDQNSRTLQLDQVMLHNLHYTKEIGLLSKKALEAGDTKYFGELLHEHWQYKVRRSKSISNPQLDEWYELGRAHGALGGKLVGAGGGGFLMFYAGNRQCLRRAMSNAGLEEVRFNFDFEGTKVVLE